jgi:hypothetical protein
MDSNVGYRTKDPVIAVSQHSDIFNCSRKKSGLRMITVRIALGGCSYGRNRAAGGPRKWNSVPSSLWMKPPLCLKDDTAMGKVCGLDAALLRVD